MVVVGKHSTIIARTGRNAEVQAFSNECNSLQQVPIVDAAIAYDCKKSGKTFVLIMKNALYIPSMERNLIPPFVTREAGLIVNDVPRIHCGKELNNESHCIVSKEADMRIPLQLRGIFSGFDLRALTREEENDCDELDVVIITPDSVEWDPYSEHYAENENQYLTWDGDIQVPTRPLDRQLLISDNDMAMETFAINVSGEQWEAALDDAVEHINAFNPQDDLLSSELFNVDQDDPIRAQVCDLTGILDPAILHDALNAKFFQSKVAMAAGCAGMPFNPQDDLDDGSFWIPIEVAVSHMEIPKGVTKDRILPRFGGLVRKRPGGPWK
jgi:hypothetical protein